MNNVALALAVIALGLGGYAVFGPKEDSGPKPASASSLDALKAEVAALRAALADEASARTAAEGRVQQLEAGAAKRDEAFAAGQTASEERIAALEAKKPSADGHLQAQRISIVDSDGKAVIRLGAATGGGGEIEVFAGNGKRVVRLFSRSDNDGELALYDENGALRANIGGNDDGGYANFYRGKEELAAYLGADSAKDCGFIGVYAGGKKEVVGLYANEKGGVISVRNAENEKQIVMIGAAPNNGMGFVGLGTADGKPALAAFVTPNGGQFKTLNAEGKTAAFIGVSADPAGNGLMYLSRPDGERLLEAGATESKGGYLSINNGADERVLFLGASSGTAPDDGVLEVARKNGKLGVVLRAYSGGSSVRVYDNNEKVKVNLR